LPKEDKKDLNKEILASPSKEDELEKRVSISEEYESSNDSSIKNSESHSSQENEVIHQRKFKLK